MVFGVGELKYKIHNRPILNSNWTFDIELVFSQYQKYHLSLQSHNLLADIFYFTESNETDSNHKQIEIAMSLTDPPGSWFLWLIWYKIL